MQQTDTVKISRSDIELFPKTSLAWDRDERDNWPNSFRDAGKNQSAKKAIPVLFTVDWKQNLVRYDRKKPQKHKSDV